MPWIYNLYFQSSIFLTKNKPACGNSIVIWVKKGEGEGEGENIHKCCRKATVLQLFATICYETYIVGMRTWVGQVPQGKFHRFSQHLKRNSKDFLLLFVRWHALTGRFTAHTVGWREVIKIMHGKLNNTESEQSPITGCMNGLTL